jgi:hypothetical protein
MFLMELPTLLLLIRWSMPMLYNITFRYRTPYQFLRPKSCYKQSTIERSFLHHARTTGRYSEYLPYTGNK